MLNIVICRVLLKSKNTDTEYVGDLYENGWDTSPTKENEIIKVWFSDRIYDLELPAKYKASPMPFWNASEQKKETYWTVLIQNDLWVSVPAKIKKKILY